MIKNSDKDLPLEGLSGKTWLSETNKTEVEQRRNVDNISFSEAAALTQWIFWLAISACNKKLLLQP